MGPYTSLEIISDSITCKIIRDSLKKLYAHDNEINKEVTETIISLNNIIENLNIIYKEIFDEDNQPHVL